MITKNRLYDRLGALADPIRCRLLLALEPQELTVNELRQILQLPQSTVSRHLRILSEDGWVSSRASGASNWYRAAVADLEPAARQLWTVVREQAAGTEAARRDTERGPAVVALRHHRSQQFFATSAGQWDRLRTELFGTALEWMALGGLLDPSWVVADLGTGTGQLAAGVAPLVARVIAVDESEAMLAAAAGRIGSAANVELRRGALERLPIEAGVADLAFAILVLHHLPAPNRAVIEAGRILRPGGRLIVVDMMPHERAEYRETMGHQWLGFPADTVAGWCREAALGRPSYRGLPPQANTDGPLLFVAAAEKPH